MRLTLLLSALLVMTAPALYARVVRGWSYDDLAKEADTVLIVSVSAPSERTGKQEDFHGQPFDTVQTKFKVHAVLKGKYSTPSYELRHIAYPTTTYCMVNGWEFRWFNQPDEFFLVFLKMTGPGSFVPLTGQEDLKWSFVSLLPDFATLLKPRTQSSVPTNGFYERSPTFH